jgi:hypothetical protein
MRRSYIPVHELLKQVLCNKRIKHNMVISSAFNTVFYSRIRLNGVCYFQKQENMGLIHMKNKNVDSDNASMVPSSEAGGILII